MHYLSFVAYLRMKAQGVQTRAASPAARLTARSQRPAAIAEAICRRGCIGRRPWMKLQWQVSTSSIVTFPTASRSPAGFMIPNRIGGVFRYWD